MNFKKKIQRIENLDINNDYLLDNEIVQVYSKIVKNFFNEEKSSIPIYYKNSKNIENYDSIICDMTENISIERHEDDSSVKKNYLKKINYLRKYIPNFRYLFCTIKYDKYLSYTKKEIMMDRFINELFIYENYKNSIKSCNDIKDCDQEMGCIFIIQSFFSIFYLWSMLGMSFNDINLKDFIFRILKDKHTIKYNYDINNIFIKTDNIITFHISIENLNESKPKLLLFLKIIDLVINKTHDSDLKKELKILRKKLFIEIRDIEKIFEFILSSKLFKKYYQNSLPNDTTKDILKLKEKEYENIFFEFKENKNNLENILELCKIRFVFNDQRLDFLINMLKEKVRDMEIIEIISRL